MNTRKPPWLWWLGITLLVLLFFGFICQRLGTLRGLLGMRPLPPNSFLGYQFGTPNRVPPPSIAINLYDPNIIEVADFGPATMTGVRASISGVPPVYLGTIRPLKSGRNLSSQIAKTSFWILHLWPVGSPRYMKIRLQYWADGYLQDGTYTIRAYPKPPFEPF